MTPAPALRPSVTRAGLVAVLHPSAADGAPRPTHPGGRLVRSDRGRRRVSIRPVVLSEPAFDDECAPPPVTRWTDGSLALALPDPEGGWTPHLRLVPPLDVDGEPRSTRNDGTLPDPKKLASRLVLGLLEVLAGGRPLRQLNGVMAPAVLDTLQRRLGGGPLPRPVRLVRVLTSRPADGVAEISAVVTTGDGRTHAIAFRLEGWDRGWLVTALETSLL